MQILYMDIPVGYSGFYIYNNGSEYFVVSSIIKGTAEEAEAINKAENGEIEIIFIE